ncbi:UDP-3-O-(3-hydroxymyristoyl) glucosamine N-acyltransferase [Isosphaera pallida ATCC 43644]|uniref:UDP-3-O-(3-hydroxymyristoyl) glucosamine N-acyltransferase n=1 Tax=Isosphaera pallida (strain ATCC 43644 / DSM 9630 / IS1B) TaxID=575540 RepID=E8QWW7_ISOPI|nr:hypothetical protein [Isosphaera pallida]ADV64006.1 UDP-3-O-(3-hydroxymyristoyl) glucosamine N-acyltransferase [Isosphaera pallida ATCC 43644]
MNAPLDKWRTPVARLMMAATLAAGLMVGSGCGGSRNLRIAGQSPELFDSPLIQNEGITIGEARRVSFVDRHPLLYKPVEWYNRAPNNPIVGVLSATVVGIPAGVLGEARQIIVGCPVRP